MTTLVIVIAYLAVVLGLGLGSNLLSRGTKQDYMLASHSIGPFLLLMSLFGTTMTAFALVGSTGRAYVQGVGVYGMLASSSGIVHSLCFYLLGVRLWTFGRRNGYTTQIQFFRDRLDSNALGLLMFPVLVALVVPYLLIGILGAGLTLNGATAGTFAPGTFPEFLEANAHGGVPRHVASAAICLVVLVYVFAGGMRGTAWANALQTMVFMLLGVVTFFVIADDFGGLRAATAAVVDQHPEKLVSDKIPRTVYASFLLIPLSVGMFPHVFQHWLTAKSRDTFKLPIVAHPVFILIVWLPCVLIGVWATTRLDLPPEANGRVLPMLVGGLDMPVLAGLLTAGVLAAVMSSLDSQFLCLGTMFTEDVVLHHFGRDRFSESRTILMARLFIVGVVVVTWVLSLFAPLTVFELGIWCFTGFTGLFPLALAACYWRRLTAAGAIASVLAMVATWLGLFVASDYAHNTKFSFLGMLPVVTVTLTATLAMVAVSLATNPPSDETLAKFFD